MERTGDHTLARMQRLARDLSATMSFTPQRGPGASGQVWSTAPPWSIEHPNYTPGFKLGVNGATQPLSNIFTSVAAAQAQYPNASITALTQEFDGAALRQLFHDWAHPWLTPGAVYACDILPSAPTTQPLIFAQAGGCIHGFGAELLAVGTSGNWDSGPQAILEANAYRASGEDLILDGGTYPSLVSARSGQFVPNGPLGVHGAFAGIWYNQCSNSQWDRIVARNCLGFGHYGSNQSSTADVVQLNSPAGLQNGVLDIWRLDLSAGASGTFTITLKDRYGGSHTTGVITIGTTQIGAAQSYNVAGLPNPGASVPGNFLEGILGLALHHPAAGAPINTFGFGSEVAQSHIYDSTTIAGITSPTGRGTVLAANSSYYLILQGDLSGSGPVSGGTWLTSVTNPSGAGTATLTHTQFGTHGGGLKTSGVDAQFWNIINARMNVNFGDGMWFQTGHNVIINPDCETNSPAGGAGIRIEGAAGGTTTVSNYVFQGDTEGNIDGIIYDSNPDASRAGTNNGLAVYDPTTANRIYKRQGTFNGDLMQATNVSGSAIPAAG